MLKTKTKTKKKWSINLTLQLILHTLPQLLHVTLMVNSGEKIVNSCKDNKQSSRVIVRKDKIKRKITVIKDLVKKNVKTITFVITLITI